MRRNTGRVAYGRHHRGRPQPEPVSGDEEPFAEQYRDRRVRIVSQLVWPGRTADELLGLRSSTKRWSTGRWKTTRSRRCVSTTPAGWMRTCWRCPCDSSPAVEMRIAASQCRIRAGRRAGTLQQTATRKSGGGHLHGPEDRGSASGAVVRRQLRQLGRIIRGRHRRSAIDRHRAGHQQLDVHGRRVPAGLLAAQRASGL